MTSANGATPGRPHRILRLTLPDSEGLTEPDYLADYDAIVMEPIWPVMFDDVPVPPGSRESMSLENLQQCRDTLDRRGNELHAFFAIGGMLVVYAAETAWLDSDENDYGRPLLSVDNQSWFFQHVQPQLRERDAGSGLLIYGRGAPIRVVEPGHPFGDYLMQRNAYMARINPVVRLYDNAVILAENRAHEPVAAEFRIAEGALLVLPHPVTADDERALTAALQDSLDARFVDREWTVEPERELALRLDDILDSLRDARASARAQLAAIQMAKSRVLGEPHVRRAISYWDRATRPNTPVAEAFQLLYRMQEMLEELHGGGEKKLAETLDLPLPRLKSLKRFANQPEYDLRHATIGDPERPASADVVKALDDARAIIQAFIEYRYDAVAKSQSDDEPPF